MIDTYEKILVPSDFVEIESKKSFETGRPRTSPFNAFVTLKDEQHEWMISHAPNGFYQLLSKITELSSIMDPISGRPITTKKLDFYIRSYTDTVVLFKLTWC